MYQFARDEWTLESTERAREGSAKFSDEKLLATIPAARYMVSPDSHWGDGPRLAYVVQIALLRLEIMKRGERLPDLFS
jgi:hypothetical protein